ncbi:hypothetical protein Tco_0121534 [Tanacetum coccineum]
MSKYCHFHEEYGHDTNDYRQLRNQIEEAVKSGQLSHLVKGIKKEKVKASENQRTKWKKDKSNTPAEAPILIIRQDESYTKNKFEGLTSESKEITFPLGGSNSSAPIVIKAKVFGREVNRVHMDSGSSCEETPLTRKETLSFMIVKSDSPYNMLPGRIAMQKMEIVVSTIHGAIKFHTTRGIVAIGKQLPEHFKGRLRDILRANADVFPWTHADMIGIPRTITVKGKSFNTEHKLNEYSHVKPIKQKRRGMGLDLNTAACKEVEELTKAGILREVKHINKADPKDCYPLPEIDWKVESLSGFRLKCFLDAYKGYHQIQMAEGDEDKTAFFAGEGVFCYRKMPLD